MMIKRMGTFMLAVLLTLAIGSTSWSQEEQAPRGVVDTAVDTGKGVVGGIGDATSEVGGAIKSGSGQVVEQARTLWEEALMPMCQRTMGAIPVIAKALVLLIAFWIVARIVGAAVTKVLSLTDLDNRAARQWGLDPMLKGTSGKSRSIEKIAGGVAKWVILLFGFIAFFNALKLQMVAEPLQNVLDKIIGVIPNLLMAFVILFAYWAVATLVKMGTSKALGAVDFDSRAGKYFPPREIKGEMVGPSAAIGRLLFYVILLFGIPPFLEALGQQALVEPLQDMLSKALAFLPNIIAAAIIVIIGGIVATIVREVVTNFLAAAGIDAGAEKVGVSKFLADKTVSGIAGTIAYFFVIVPVIVSAVDSLQIKAISEPVKSTLEQVLAAIPAILVATIIVVVGYMVAKIVRDLFAAFLSGLGFDALPGKAGLSFLKPKSGASLSSIGGTIVMVIILLLTAQQALASLGFAQLSALVDELVRYLPQLVVGLLILFAALWLGNYIGGLTEQATKGSGHAKFVSAVAKYAIIFLGISMALDQLGVGEQIVTTAVSAVLGGTALALGIAFGLGGKDKAKAIIEKNL